MTVVNPSTLGLVDSSHPQAVLSHLSEQRSQGLFCDVIIVVEDVKFRAHRNILAATSGYFRNAFKTLDLLPPLDITPCQDAEPPCLSPQNTPNVSTFSCQQCPETF
uniref:BTB domain-containing protein n=1 Tax=Cyprinus carpio TaxID=7962 RepID=A0A8C2C0L8_CYPCA